MGGRALGHSASLYWRSVFRRGWDLAQKHFSHINIKQKGGGKGEKEREKQERRYEYKGVDEELKVL